MKVILAGGSGQVGTVLARLVLKSRRVVPGRLLRDGFSFAYAKWAEAAQALCRERRARSD